MAIEPEKHEGGLDKDNGEAGKVSLIILSPQSQLVNYAWQINKRTNKNLFYQQY